jgi:hydrogenase expression/formation protein HypD
MGFYMVLKEYDEGTTRLENEYTRVVKWKGNQKPLEMMDKAFAVTGGNWRGIGRLPDSVLKLREELKVEQGRDMLLGCECHLVIIGKIKPDECLCS